MHSEIMELVLPASDLPFQTERPFNHVVSAADLTCRLFAYINAFA